MSQPVSQGGSKPPPAGEPLRAPEQGPLAAQERGNNEIFLSFDVRPELAEDSRERKVELDREANANTLLGPEARSIPVESDTLPTARADAHTNAHSEEQSCAEQSSQTLVDISPGESSDSSAHRKLFRTERRASAASQSLLHAGVTEDTDLGGDEGESDAELSPIEINDLGVCEQLSSDDEYDDDEFGTRPGFPLRHPEDLAGGMHLDIQIDQLSDDSHMRAEHLGQTEADHDFEEAAANARIAEAAAAAALAALHHQDLSEVDEPLHNTHDDDQDLDAEVDAVLMGTHVPELEDRSHDVSTNVDAFSNQPLGGTDSHHAHDHGMPRHGRVGKRGHPRKPDTTEMQRLSSLVAAQAVEAAHTAAKAIRRLRRRREEMMNAPEHASSFDEHSSESHEIDRHDDSAMVQTHADGANAGTSTFERCTGEYDKRRIERLKRRGRNVRKTVKLSPVDDKSVRPNGDDSSSEAEEGDEPEGVSSYAEEDASTLARLTSKTRRRGHRMQMEDVNHLRGHGTIRESGEESEEVTDVSASTGDESSPHVERDVSRISQAASVPSTEVLESTSPEPSMIRQHTQQIGGGSALPAKLAIRGENLTLGVGSTEYSASVSSLGFATPAGITPVTTPINQSATSRTFRTPSMALGRGLHSSGSNTLRPSGSSVISHTRASAHNRAQSLHTSQFRTGSHGPSAAGDDSHQSHALAAVATGKLGLLESALDADLNPDDDDTGVHAKHHASDRIAAAHIAARLAMAARAAPTLTRKRSTRGVDFEEEVPSESEEIEAHPLMPSASAFEDYHQVGSTTIYPEPTAANGTQDQTSQVPRKPSIDSAATPLRYQRSIASSLGEDSRLGLATRSTEGTEMRSSSTLDGRSQLEKVAQTPGSAATGGLAPSDATTGNSVQSSRQPTGGLGLLLLRSGGKTTSGKEAPVQSTASPIPSVKHTSPSLGRSSSAGSTELPDQTGASRPSPDLSNKYDVQSPKAFDFLPDPQHQLQRRQHSETAASLLALAKPAVERKSSEPGGVSQQGSMRSSAGVDGAIPGSRPVSKSISEYPAKGRGTNAIHTAAPETGESPQFASVLKPTVNRDRQLSSPSLFSSIDGFETPRTRQRTGSASRPDQYIPSLLTAQPHAHDSEDGRSKELHIGSDSFALATPIHGPLPPNTVLRSDHTRELLNSPNISVLSSPSVASMDVEIQLPPVSLPRPMLQPSTTSSTDTERTRLSRARPDGSNQLVAEAQPSATEPASTLHASTPASVALAPVGAGLSLELVGAQASSPSVSVPSAHQEPTGDEGRKASSMRGDLDEKSPPSTVDKEPVPIASQVVGGSESDLTTSVSSPFGSLPTLQRADTPPARETLSIPAAADTQSILTDAAEQARSQLTSPAALFASQGEGTAGLRPQAESSPSSFSISGEKGQRTSVPAVCIPHSSSNATPVSSPTLGSQSAVIPGSAATVVAAPTSAALNRSLPLVTPSATKSELDQLNQANELLLRFVIALKKANPEVAKDFGVPFSLTPPGKPECEPPPPLQIPGASGADKAELKDLNQRDKPSRASPETHSPTFSSDAADSTSYAPHSILPSLGDITALERATSGPTAAKQAGLSLLRSVSDADAVPVRSVDAKPYHMPPPDRSGAQSVQPVQEVGSVSEPVSPISLTFPEQTKPQITHQEAADIDRATLDVAVVPTVPGHVISGDLMKQSTGKLFQSWKRRFFELLATGEFYYYDSEARDPKTRTPVILSNRSIARAVPAHRVCAGYEYAFTLRCVIKGEERLLHLALTKDTVAALKRQKLEFTRTSLNQRISRLEDEANQAEEAHTAAQQKLVEATAQLSAAVPHRSSFIAASPLGTTRHIVTGPSDLGLSALQAEVTRAQEEVDATSAAAAEAWRALEAAKLELALLEARAKRQKHSRDGDELEAEPEALRDAWVNALNNVIKAKHGLDIASPLLFDDPSRDATIHAGTLRRLLRPSRRGRPPIWREDAMKLTSEALIVYRSNTQRSGVREVVRIDSHMACNPEPRGTFEEDWVFSLSYLPGIEKTNVAAEMAEAAEAASTAFDVEKIAALVKAAQSDTESEESDVIPHRKQPDSKGRSRFTNWLKSLFTRKKRDDFESNIITFSKADVAAAGFDFDDSDEESESENEYERFERRRREIRRRQLMLQAMYDDPDEHWPGDSDESEEESSSESSDDRKATDIEDGSQRASTTNDEENSDSDSTGHKHGHSDGDAEGERRVSFNMGEADMGDGRDSTMHEARLSQSVRARKPKFHLEDAHTSVKRFTEKFVAAQAQRTKSKLSLRASQVGLLPDRTKHEADVRASDHLTRIAEVEAQPGGAAETLKPNHPPHAHGDGIHLIKYLLRPMSDCSTYDEALGIWKDDQVSGLSRHAPADPVSEVVLHNRQVLRDGDGDDGASTAVDTVTHDDDAKATELTLAVGATAGLTRLLRYCERMQASGTTVTGTGPTRSLVLGQAAAELAPNEVDEVVVCGQGDSLYSPGYIAQSGSKGQASGSQQPFVLIFSCSSEQERDEWVQKIQAAIARQADKQMLGFARIYGLAETLLTHATFAGTGPGTGAIYDSGCTEGGPGAGKSTVASDDERSSVAETTRPDSHDPTSQKQRSLKLQEVVAEALDRVGYGAQQHNYDRSITIRAGAGHTTITASLLPKQGSSTRPQLPQAWISSSGPRGPPQASDSVSRTPLIAPFQDRGMTGQAMSQETDSGYPENANLPSLGPNRAPSESTRSMSSGPASGALMPMSSTGTTPPTHPLPGSQLTAHGPPRRVQGQVAPGPAETYNPTMTSSFAHTMRAAAARQLAAYVRGPRGPNAGGTTPTGPSPPTSTQLSALGQLATSGSSTMFTPFGQPAGSPVAGADPMSSSGHHSVLHGPLYNIRSDTGESGSGGPQSRASSPALDDTVAELGSRSNILNSLHRFGRIQRRSVGVGNDTSSTMMAASRMAAAAAAAVAASAATNVPYLGADYFPAMHPERRPFASQQTTPVAGDYAGTMSPLIISPAASTIGLRAPDFAAFFQKQRLQQGQSLTNAQEPASYFMHVPAQGPTTSQLNSPASISTENTYYTIGTGFRPLAQAHVVPKFGQKLPKLVPPVSATPSPMLLAQSSPLGGLLPGSSQMSPLAQHEKAPPPILSPRTEAAQNLLLTTSLVPGEAGAAAAAALGMANPRATQPASQSHLLPPLAPISSSGASPESPRRTKPKPKSTLATLFQDPEETLEESGGDIEGQDKIDNIRPQPQVQVEEHVQEKLQNVTTPTNVPCVLANSVDEALKRNAELTQLVRTLKAKLSGASLQNPQVAAPVAGSLVIPTLTLAVGGSASGVITSGTSASMTTSNSTSASALLSNLLGLPKAGAPALPSVSQPNPVTDASHAPPHPFTDGLQLGDAKAHAPIAPPSSTSIPLTLPNLTSVFRLPTPSASVAPVSASAVSPPPPPLPVTHEPGIQSGSTAVTPLSSTTSTVAGASSAAFPLLPSTFKLSAPPSRAPPVSGAPMGGTQYAVPILPPLRKDVFKTHVLRSGYLYVVAAPHPHHHRPTGITQGAGMLTPYPTPLPTPHQDRSMTTALTVTKAAGEPEHVRPKRFFFVLVPHALFFFNSEEDARAADAEKRIRGCMALPQAFILHQIPQQSSKFLASFHLETPISTPDNSQPNSPSALDSNVGAAKQPVDEIVATPSNSLTVISRCPKSYRLVAATPSEALAWYTDLQAQSQAPLPAGVSPAPFFVSEEDEAKRARACKLAKRRRLALLRKLEAKNRDEALKFLRRPEYTVRRTSNNSNVSSDTDSLGACLTDSELKSDPLSDPRRYAKLMLACDSDEAACITKGMVFHESKPTTVDEIPTPVPVSPAFDLVPIKPASDGIWRSPKRPIASAPHLMKALAAVDPHLFLPQLLSADQRGFMQSGLRRPSFTSIKLLPNHNSIANPVAAALLNMCRQDLRTTFEHMKSTTRDLKIHQKIRHSVSSPLSQESALSGTGDDQRIEFLSVLKLNINLIAKAFTALFEPSVFAEVSNAPLHPPFDRSLGRLPAFPARPSDAASMSRSSVRLEPQSGGHAAITASTATLEEILPSPSARNFYTDATTALLSRRLLIRCARRSWNEAATRALIKIHKALQSRLELVKKVELAICRDIQRYDPTFVAPSSESDSMPSIIATTVRNAGVFATEDFIEELIRAEANFAIKEEEGAISSDKEPAYDSQPLFSPNLYCSVGDEGHDPIYALPFVSLLADSDPDFALEPARKLFDAVAALALRNYVYRLHGDTISLTSGFDFEKMHLRESDSRQVLQIHVNGERVSNPPTSATSTASRLYGSTDYSSAVAVNRANVATSPIVSRVLESLLESSSVASFLSGGTRLLSDFQAYVPAYLAEVESLSANEAAIASGVRSLPTLIRTGLAVKQRLAGLSQRVGVLLSMGDVDNPRSLSGDICNMALVTGLAARVMNLPWLRSLLPQATMSSSEVEAVNGVIADLAILALGIGGLSPSAERCRISILRTLVRLDSAAVRIQQLLTHRRDVLRGSNSELCVTPIANLSTSTNDIRRLDAKFDPLPPALEVDVYGDEAALQAIVEGTVTSLATNGHKVPPWNAAKDNDSLARRMTSSTSHLLPPASPTIMRVTSIGESPRQRPGEARPTGLEKRSASYSTNRVGATKLPEVIEYDNPQADVAAPEDGGSMRTRRTSHSGRDSSFRDIREDSQTITSSEREQEDEDHDTTAPEALVSPDSRSPALPYGEQVRGARVRKSSLWKRFVRALGAGNGSDSESDDEPGTAEIPRIDSPSQARSVLASPSRANLYTQSHQTPKKRKKSMWGCCSAPADDEDQVDSFNLSSQVNVTERRRLAQLAHSSSPPHLSTPLNSVHTVDRKEDADDGPEATERLPFWKQMQRDSGPFAGNESLASANKPGDTGKDSTSPPSHPSPTSQPVDTMTEADIGSTQADSQPTQHSYSQSHFQSQSQTQIQPASTTKPPLYRGTSPRHTARDALTQDSLDGKSLTIQIPEVPRSPTLLTQRSVSYCQGGQQFFVHSQQAQAPAGTERPRGLSVGSTEPSHTQAIQGQTQTAMSPSGTTSAALPVGPSQLTHLSSLQQGRKGVAPQVMVDPLSIREGWLMWRTTTVPSAAEKSAVTAFVTSCVAQTTTPNLPTPGLQSNNPPSYAGKADAAVLSGWRPRYVMLSPGPTPGSPYVLRLFSRVPTPIWSSGTKGPSADAVPHQRSVGEAVPYRGRPELLIPGTPAGGASRSRLVRSISSGNIDKDIENDLLASEVSSGTFLMHTHSQPLRLKDREKLVMSLAGATAHLHPGIPGLPYCFTVVNATRTERITLCAYSLRDRDAWASAVSLAGMLVSRPLTIAPAIDAPIVRAYYANLDQARINRNHQPKYVTLSQWLSDHDKATVRLGPRRAVSINPSDSQSGQSINRISPKIPMLPVPCPLAEGDVAVSAWRTYSWAAHAASHGATGSCSDGAPDHDPHRLGRPAELPRPSSGSPTFLTLHHFQHAIDVARFFLHAGYVDVPHRVYEWLSSKTLPTSAAPASPSGGTLIGPQATATSTHSTHPSAGFLSDSTQRMAYLGPPAPTDVRSALRVTHTLDPASLTLSVSETPVLSEVIINHMTTFVSPDWVSVVKTQNKVLNSLDPPDVAACTLPALPPHLPLDETFGYRRFLPTSAGAIAPLVSQSRADGASGSGVYLSHASTSNQSTTPTSQVSPSGSDSLSRGQRIKDESSSTSRVSTFASRRVSITSALHSQLHVDNADLVLGTAKTVRQRIPLASQPGAWSLAGAMMLARLPILTPGFPILRGSEEWAHMTAVAIAGWAASSPARSAEAWALSPLLGAQSRSPLAILLRLLTAAKPGSVLQLHARLARVTTDKLPTSRPSSSVYTGVHEYHHGDSRLHHHSLNPTFGHGQVHKSHVHDPTALRLPLLRAEERILRDLMNESRIMGTTTPGEGFVSERAAKAVAAATLRTLRDDSSPDIVFEQSKILKQVIPNVKPSLLTVSPQIVELSRGDAVAVRSAQSSSSAHVAPSFDNPALVRALARDCEPNPRSLADAIAIPGLAPALAAASTHVQPAGEAAMMWPRLFIAVARESIATLEDEKVRHGRVMYIFKDHIAAYNFMHQYAQKQESLGHSTPRAWAYPSYSDHDFHMDGTTPTATSAETTGHESHPTHHHQPSMNIPPAPSSSWFCGHGDSQALAILGLDKAQVARIPVEVSGRIGTLAVTAPWVVLPHHNRLYSSPVLVFGTETSTGTAKWYDAIVQPVVAQVPPTATTHGASTVASSTQPSGRTPPTSSLTPEATTPAAASSPMAASTTAAESAPGRSQGGRSAHKIDSSSPPSLQPSAPSEPAKSAPLQAQTPSQVQSQPQSQQQGDGDETR